MHRTFANGIEEGNVHGLGTLTMSAVGLAVWAWNVYMPSFTPHCHRNTYSRSCMRIYTLMNQSEEIQEAYSSHLPGGDGLAEWFERRGRGSARISSPG